MVKRKHVPAACPCGTGAVLADCCGPLLGGATAPDPERLMRSRYTAFARGDEAYLLATWHPRTRPSRVRLDPQQRWIGLSIRDVRLDSAAARGEVEFVARYKLAGRGHRLHERSRFEWIDGHWYYLDGEHFT
jgi:SEC-C motif-containing protein